MAERVDVVQVASFAVMVGLAEVWASVGVTPDAVLGHSQGEIAAACVAGALSLEDAARVVALRSRAIAQTLAGRGGMASVALGEAEAVVRLAPWADRVSVAAVNGPSSVVIAGDADALDEALAAWEEAGVRVRRVAVDYASHTRHVEALEATLAEALAGIEARAPVVPFHSTVTGDWINDSGALDAGYWYRNLRQPVRFGSATTNLLDAGFTTFVEISAHPVLIQPVTETAATAVVATGSLRRDDGGLPRLLTSMADVFVTGTPVDWTAILPTGTGTWADLPTYAFDHQHYWLREAEPTDTTETTGDDTDFWTAVERTDTGALAQLLDVTADQGGALDAVKPILATWRGKRRERSTAEKLRYHVTWQPLTRSTTGVPGGRWLLVVPAAAATGDLTQALTSQGLDAIPLEVTAADLTRTRLGERFTGILAEHDVSGVLSLLALDGAGNANPTAVTATTLALIQALGDAGAAPPLWCLTSGAVTVGSQDAVTAPAQAALWGLGRAAALEQPGRWGGLVDLPATTDPRHVRHLLGVLGGATGEDQLAIRRSGVYARRLVRKPVPVPAGERWRPRGTILVTGGAEGLGRYASLWLARAGAERLVVTTTADAGERSVAELRTELADLGVTTTVDACVDGDRDELARLLSTIAPDRPLTGVVHAADVTQTSTIDATGDRDLTGVFPVKVDPAVWLDDLLGETPLDAFVVFSSIAGVWGGGGQGLSGAANAVLDALVESRRARGLTATSIAWGALDQIGIGMDSTALAQLRRRGVLPMPPQVAMTALDQAVEAGETSVTVADMDWSAFTPAFTSVRPSPLFAELPEASAALRAVQPTENSDATSSLVDSLRAVPEPEQNRILLRLVRDHAAAVLGHGSADAIAARQAFQEVGFDSLAAINLRNSLNAATGLRLPTTLIFDYPTPDAIVGYLRGELLRDIGDDLGDREDDLRRTLATLPLARFKEVGVLDALLALASTDPAPDAEATEAVQDELTLIDAMDVADLVQRALGHAN